MILDDKWPNIQENAIINFRRFEFHKVQCLPLLVENNPGGFSCRKIGHD